MSLSSKVALHPAVRSRCGLAAHNRITDRSRQMITRCRSSRKFESAAETSEIGTLVPSMAHPSLPVSQLALALASDAGEGFRVLPSSKREPSQRLTTLTALQCLPTNSSCSALRARMTLGRETVACDTPDSGRAPIAPATVPGSLCARTFESLR